MIPTRLDLYILFEGFFFLVLSSLATFLNFPPLIRIFILVSSCCLSYTSGIYVTILEPKVWPSNTSASLKSSHVKDGVGNVRFWHL